MSHSYKTTETEAVPIDVPLKCVLAIVNPNSGNKQGLKAFLAFKSKLELANITVRMLKTTHAGHCKEICQTEDLTGVDVIAAIGGDGTLCEAVNGLLTRTQGTMPEVYLSIVPAGTGNTVAFDLGIRDAKHAADILLGGKFRKLDVAKLTPLNDEESIPPLYSMNICGWAMTSSVMKTANKFRFLGFGAFYNMATYAYLLGAKSFAAKITLTDADNNVQVLEGNWALFCVQNTVHLGAKTPLCPLAKLDDGLLDLTVMEKKNLLTNVKTLKLAQKGEHVSRAQVKQFKVKQVLLENKDKKLAGPNSMNVDGELCGTSPCRIVVLPNVLKVLTQ